MGIKNTRLGKKGKQNRQKIPDKHIENKSERNTTFKIVKEKMEIDRHRKEKRRDDGNKTDIRNTG